MNDQRCQLITAYHDGELDPVRVHAVRSMLKQDAEARAYLEELQGLDKVLCGAFGPIADAGVPPSFRPLVRKSWRTSPMRFFVPLAVAASLVLVAVLVVRQNAVDEQMHEQLMQMQRQIAALKNQTLENLPSGSAASWEGPGGLARAQVTPLKTYRAKDNRFCREYEERIEDARGVEMRRGIACRVGKSDWPDLTQALPGAQREPLTNL